MVLEEAQEQQPRLEQERAAAQAQVNAETSRQRAARSAPVRAEAVAGKRADPGQGPALAAKARTRRCRACGRSCTSTKAGKPRWKRSARAHLRAGNVEPRLGQGLLQRCAAGQAGAVRTASLARCRRRRCCRRPETLRQSAASSTIPACARCCRTGCTTSSSPRTPPAPSPTAPSCRPAAPSSRARATWSAASSVRFYAADSEQDGMLARQQEIDNIGKQLRAQHLLADEARARSVRADAAVADMRRAACRTRASASPR